MPKTWKGIEIPSVKTGRNKGVLRALRARKRAEAEGRAEDYATRKRSEWVTP